MIKLILNTFLTKLVLAILRFIMNVFLARFLGPELKGLYWVLQNAIGFISALSTFSVGESYTYYLGKEKLSIVAIKCINILVVAVGSIISGLLLYLIFNLNLNDKLDFNIFFFPSFVLCIALIYEYLLMQELKARLEIYRANILYVLSRVALLVYVVGHGPTLEAVDVIFYSIYSSVILMGMLFLAALWFEDYKKWGVFSDLKRDIKRWRDYLKYSLQAHFGTLINLFEYRVDALLAVYFIDLKLLGVYSVALSFGQLNYYIVNSINTVLFPTIVRDSMELSEYLRVLRMAMIPIVLGTSGVVLGVNLLGTIVFGQEYTEIGIYVALLAPIFVLESYNRLFATLLKAHNALHEFNRIAIYSLCLYFPLLFLFGYLFSIKGLILASFFSYFFRSLLYVGWIRVSLSDNLSIYDFLPKSEEVVGVTKIIWGKYKDR